MAGIFFSIHVAKDKRKFNNRLRKGKTIFECTCMCKLNAGYLSFDINRSLKSNTKSFYTLLKK